MNNSALFHFSLLLFTSSVASSKDGGNRVMTIEEVSDNALYRPLITRLAKNGGLVLKSKGGAK